VSNWPISDAKERLISDSVDWATIVPRGVIVLLFQIPTCAVVRCPSQLVALLAGMRLA